MRRGTGDHVILFDGCGRRMETEIVSSNGKHVELTCIAASHTPPPSVSITLMQAVPKGANMEFIIEKAVELGVNEIIPVMSARTVVKIDA